MPTTETLESPPVETVAEAPVPTEQTTRCTCGRTFTQHRLDLPALSTWTWTPPVCERCDEAAQVEVAAHERRQERVEREQRIRAFLPRQYRLLARAILENDWCPAEGGFPREAWEGFLRDWRPLFTEGTPSRVERRGQAAASGESPTEGPLAGDGFAGLDGDAKPGLMLVSTRSGAWKTTLAVALAMRELRETGRSIGFFNMAEYANLLRRQWEDSRRARDEAQRKLAAAKRCGLLVLDDINKVAIRAERWRKHGMDPGTRGGGPANTLEEAFYDLVEHRTSEARPMIVTSRVGPSQLEAQFAAVGTDVVRRLLDYCTVVEWD